MITRKHGKTEIRHIKLITISVVLIMTTLIVTGCSGSKEANNKGKGEQATKGEAKPMQLVAGSASSGGANYLIMSGWAEIVNKNTQHRIIVEATGGPRSNIELIGNGNAKIGVVSQSIAVPAFEGKEWAAGKKYDMLRTLIGLHEAYMDGIALESSGIKTYYDLNGKTVSVGPAGGTPAMVAPAVFNILGIKPKIVNLGQGDSINAIKDGQIDAAVFFGGYPRPAYKELEASHKVNFLSFSDADLQKLLPELPAFTLGVIPAGTYANLKEDNKTLKDRYAIVADKNIPEEVIYEIVKATLNNLEEFQKVHKSLKVLDKNSILEGIAIPLHPGALKAYKEAGIPVPDRLIPPELK